MPCLASPLNTRNPPAPKVTPENERGEVELCLVRASKEQSQPCLLFEYQQQRHFIDEGSDQVRCFRTPTPTAPFTDLSNDVMKCCEPEPMSRSR